MRAYERGAINRFKTVYDKEGQALGFWVMQSGVRMTETGRRVTDSNIIRRSPFFVKAAGMHQHISLHSTRPGLIADSYRLLID
jgi:hypothetical protein